MGGGGGALLNIPRLARDEELGLTRGLPVSEWALLPTLGEPSDTRSTADMRGQRA